MTHGIHLTSTVSSHIIDSVQIWRVTCSTAEEQRSTEKFYYIGSLALFLLVSYLFSTFYVSFCNIFHFPFYFDPTVTKRERKCYLFGLENTGLWDLLVSWHFSDGHWVTPQ